ncbi:MAG: hypothetical protein JW723_01425 [Bacteroidales bacterium]|nr:hypothetical protein [Bacteroidales bacterium]
MYDLPRIIIISIHLKLEKDRFFMESVDKEWNKLENKIHEGWKRAE